MRRESCLLFWIQGQAGGNYRQSVLAPRAVKNWWPGKLSPNAISAPGAVITESYLSPFSDAGLPALADSYPLSSSLPEGCWSQGSLPEPAQTSRYVRNVLCVHRKENKGRKDVSCIDCPRSRRWDKDSSTWSIWEVILGNCWGTRWRRDGAYWCVSKPVTLWAMDLSLTWGSGKCCNTYTSKLPHLRVRELVYLPYISIVGRLHDIGHAKCLLICLGQYKDLIYMLETYCCCYD